MTASGFLKAIVLLTEFMAVAAATIKRRNRCSGSPKCFLGRLAVMHKVTSTVCEEICSFPALHTDYECGFCDGKACQRSFFVDSGAMVNATDFVISGQTTLYDTTASVSAVGGFKEKLFQGHRWGSSFNLTVAGFEPGCKSDIVIGFAEVVQGNCYETKRVIDISVNGQLFASNLDVYKKAGCFVGHVETQLMTADTQGKFVFAFSSTAEKPMVSFLQIGDAKPTPVTNKPTAAPKQKPIAPPKPVPTAKPITQPAPRPIMQPIPPAPKNKPIRPPTGAPISPPTKPTPVIPTQTKVTYVPGELTVEENGLLLSTGLTSKILATKGKPVSYDTGGQSTALFHRDADGGATFVDTNTFNIGGWIYVSNAEVRALNGVPEGQGGVGAFTFNKDGQLINYRMVMQNTTANCGGGRTPWNTWVSCEEYDRGTCWQVDPRGMRKGANITMGEKGRGPFESFAFDVRNKATPRFYVTKDDVWGELRRFTPDKADWQDPWNILHGPGKLDYLVLTPNSNANGGTYEWVSDRFTGSESAMKYYRNAEGIDVLNNQLFFIAKVYKTMFILDLDGTTYTNVTTLHGLLDGQPDQVQRIVGSNGDLLYFTEDGGEYAGVHARNRQGQFFSILESHIYSDETTGLSFSPDGKYMYISYQVTGLLFQISRTDGLSFDAQTLNVKFHAA